jgi:hypothetical protein
MHWPFRKLSHATSDLNNTSDYAAGPEHATSELDTFADLRIDQTPPGVT